MNSISVELLGILITAVSGLVTAAGWVYKKIVKPLLDMARNQETLIDNVKKIKEEVTANGGKSLKDVITRMEGRQIIIDHRSRAMLSDTPKPIFEVDYRGHIMWGNRAFYEMIGPEEIDGLDWVTFMDEHERERFINEFKACVKQVRELLVSVKDHKTNDQLEIHGYPYRDSDKSRNYGFLIFVQKH